MDKIFGAIGGTRTHTGKILSLVSLPIGLLSHTSGAGYGNRTRLVSLGS
jgi:hypothetical protein